VVTIRLIEKKDIARVAALDDPQNYGNRKETGQERLMGRRVSITSKVYFLIIKIFLL
jgi:hypothetical protein